MSNETLQAEKTFNKNVSELYQAWTDESALKEWWKPSGNKLKSLTADLEKGGELKYDFESDNNGDLIIEGTYEEVIPEEKLVYTWNWILDNVPVENGEYKLTVSFSAEGEGSKLSITQESLNENEGIHPNKSGWDTALNDLENYLSK
ncbi:SRPBCC family protein [Pedobacter mucosus]|uniref:SRPBCC family protein n=1 Tax=Pedobacter mucosus TaxID=2895286 RepID=UPI001EE42C30|nr:SRPBCC domain-containing protein [Pedobacter mucosus]UKT62604.1 SRPBCC domain-containing protein [Pedobacter mucosus]